MPTEWDAATYDRVANPQARWGLAILDRLRLNGDERVLDAGCGSGRVTEQLIERLPNGRVIALDGSASMLSEARRRLARSGDRVQYVLADLEQPLPIDPPVDAILSTATFHWVRDHSALFRHLAAVLLPGGQLVAQCGGKGNVATLERVLTDMGAGGVRRTFAGPEETAKRLVAAGFVDVETWLSDEPTRFEPGQPFEEFLETVCLREHLAGMIPDERPAFVSAVAARMPEPLLDYVRLNIVARRGWSDPTEPISDRPGTARRGPG
jgi:trans-aconitate 2-methyltransferase